MELRVKAAMQSDFANVSFAVQTQPVDANTFAEHLRRCMKGDLILRSNSQIAKLGRRQTQ